jgi:hypothetical protein
VNGQKPSPQSSRRDFWRGCKSAADCGEGEVCVAIDPRPEQAMLAASLLEPRACAVVVPADVALHDGPDFRKRFLERLLLLPKTRITLSASGCTLMWCGSPDGAPAQCCNGCDGEYVWLSAFEGVSLIAPDGKVVRCAGRMDCELPKCPSWAYPYGKLEFVGAFHTVHQNLVFQLAGVPREVN